METGISVERAIELIEQYTAPVETCLLRATKAQGRILSQDIHSPMNQPPWPRSPLDGYAFRAADSAGASEQSPVSLTVVETLYAGSWTERIIQPGEAVRLMTGAPIPQGCDCVIRQEDTDCGTETVCIHQELKPFDNYVPAGGDFRAGDLLLPAGTRLNGNALGLLAAAGLYREEIMLPVYRRVRCALICTGDELVSNDTRPLPPGKIYSSNAAVISSRLHDLGVEVTTLLPNFSDSADALADAIYEAAETADVIITTGGVSVGAKDILHKTLPLLFADQVFWKVRLKPGSPLMFSLYRERPFLCLSGNPFAASATFELFARPMLAKRSGCADLKMCSAEAVLAEPFTKTCKGRRFVRAHLQDGRVMIPKGHSSGQLASAVGANCLAEIPPCSEPLAAESRVKVWLL